MKKIALVPIDDRPVCYNLPKLITETDNNNKIFLPDINIMGGLKKSADTDAILEWLHELDDIDIIVLSLDTIAYGGLIPSRRSNEDFNIIKKRIDKLKRILKTKKSEIYAFSSIMRISNNNINEEEKEYWSEWGKKIFEYSYNLHRSKKKIIIPEEILNDYLNTRKRNFEINKYYIELKKQGIFNTLVFSKDDCSEYGLNVREAEELKTLSENIEDIYIKTGADEIPVSLISRALNKGKKIRIHPVYTVPEAINKISKYEDISVETSVNSQIELSGGIISSYDEADLILLINNFKNEQGELVMNIFEPGYKNDLELPDKPYFIADILNANGSDNNFVENLLKKDLNTDFYGYAAWNTTGNTLGSTLAAALTYYGAKQKNTDIFKKLQLIRFLDDWGYQANLRKKIKENKINDESKLLKKLDIKEIKVQYSFPWNRFFEIKIDILPCE